MGRCVDALPTPLPTFPFFLFTFTFFIPIPAFRLGHLFHPPSLPMLHHQHMSADEPNTCISRLPSAFCPGERDELGQFVIVFRDIVVYDNRCPLSGSSWYVGNRSGINGSYRGENHEDLYPGVTTGSQWCPPPGG